ncbi:MAG: radical SAM protein [Bacteroidota bacterium]
MAGILFDQIVFGPVRSRRLGVSLGMNLLPTNGKLCSFNCIYCECGWTDYAHPVSDKLHSRKDIRESLEQRLIALAGENMLPDAITFAGNGEPTLHPDFTGIVDDTVALRDKYSPLAQVAVLSNSSTLDRPGIIAALMKTNNMMKLDAGSDGMFRTINNPKSNINLATIVENLKKFNGQLTIQSMFFKGEYNGKPIDNTTDEELIPWLGYLKEINPRSVMIYSLDRRPPAQKLEKLSAEELEAIAVRIRAIGLNAKIY